MASLFCRCACYFTDNIFLKTVGKHVNLHGEQEFLEDYQALAKFDEFCVKDLLKEAEVEVERRQIFVQEEAARKKCIEANYFPIFPEVYEFKNRWLDSEFVALCQISTEHSISNFQKYKVVPGFDIYSIPIFSPEFCSKLLTEINAFENSQLPKPRPNTMNNYGVILDELGFRKFFEELRRKYFDPLARILFPDFVGKSTGLDSHRAFTVSYSMDSERDLSWHFDNAEVTLNVGLSDCADYSGGELVFLDGNGDESQFCSLPLCHKRGWGFFHVARMFHSALSLMDGKRSNLILWMRSSEIRNKMCPMCQQKPELIPVSDPDEYGDGFTLHQFQDASVQVCSCL